MSKQQSPLVRTLLFWTGVLLIILSAPVGLIPGPGGIFVFAGGLALVLRTSPWARRRFARIKRRYPRFGRLVDKVMRRASALRREKISAEASDHAEPADLGRSH